jgi:hypothetical protein
MKLSRPSRLIAAAFALISILFMQLAVAAYACPAFSVHDSRGTVANKSAMPDDAMTACDDMDPVQPSLCHAYGQAGHQSLDKPALALPQPFVAVGFGLPITPFNSIALAALTVHRDTFLAHASAPPLAIRHCCFRI